MQGSVRGTLVLCCLIVVAMAIPAHAADPMRVERVDYVASSLNTCALEGEEWLGEALDTAACFEVLPGESRIHLLVEDDVGASVLAWYGFPETGGTLDGGVSEIFCTETEFDVPAGVTFLAVTVYAGVAPTFEEACFFDVATVGEITASFS